jgi:hypothetical protein
VAKHKETKEITKKTAVAAQQEYTPAALDIPCFLMLERRHIRVSSSWFNEQLGSNGAVKPLHTMEWSAS